VSLPLNQATFYSVELPSTGQKIKFRQFLVKEQKALLIAQQSEDESVMIDTLKNIIKQCVQGSIDVDKLAMFDIEYLFVMMRARSVGENVEIIMQCPNSECVKDDQSKVVVNIDLTTIKVNKDPEHTNKIPLFDDVGVVMKYPSLETVRTMRNINMSDPLEAIDIIINCIDYIYDTDQIFNPNEVSKEEMVEFVDNLNDQQMNNIKKFIRTMPRLYKDIEFTCPVCGKKHVKRLEGLVSFF